MEPQYEITQTFYAKHPGRCLMDSGHRIKPDTLVGKVRRADNPFLVVSGVVCKNCMREIPRAVED